MTYTINQLAKLARVSVRTLHYYDEIGLLKPSHIRTNGYREYSEQELLLLQQILFFRELDFPLAEIKRITASPYFDPRTALIDQRKLLEIKQKRIKELIITIDKTIKKLNHEESMNDQELYNAFDDQEQRRYATEVKERWGHTDAYQQSQKRLQTMTKSDLATIQKDTDALMKKIVATLPQGVRSTEFKALIAQHYENLRTWYEPNLKIYRGLAEMYITDPRFKAYYENYAPGLAQAMHDAMIDFCDTHET